MRVRTVAAVLLLGVAFAPVPAREVKAAPVQAPAIGLSGYDLRGRGSGVLVSYDIPGRLPISPILDIAAPDVQASVSAGPTPAASSSLAYPGPLVLSLDTLFAQFGGFDNPLPPYAAIVRAPSPAGTSAEDTSTVPGGSMSASAEGASASATAIMPARATPAVASLGTVTATTSTTIEGQLATTHVRIEVDGVDVLGDLIQIDGLVTDLTVTTDGATATTSGGTTFASASALGLPVVIDAEGIRFAEGDPWGLDALLEEVGIQIRLGEPLAEVQGPAGSLQSAGLAIDFSAELDATPLGQLFDLIPTLPELPGSPFQAADLIAIIGANHVAGVSIGSATATASARPLPARTTPDRPGIPSATPAGAGTGGGAAASPVSGRTPTGSVGSSGTESSAPAASQRTAIQLPLADLVGWRMVVLAVAAALLASLGIRKLPDLALAPSAARHCALGTAPERSAP